MVAQHPGGGDASRPCRAMSITCRSWRQLAGNGASLGPLRLANPVLVASGTFGYASELAGLVDLARLGGIVTKTVTVKPRPGNPPPRIVETPAGMLNAIGLQNVGIDRFVTEKLPYLAGLDPVVLVSIMATRPANSWPWPSGWTACRGWMGWN